LQLFPIWPKKPAAALLPEGIPAAAPRWHASKKAPVG
jgi:hypothetical protein